MPTGLDRRGFLKAALGTTTALGAAALAAGSQAAGAAEGPAAAGAGAGEGSGVGEPGGDGGAPLSLLTEPMLQDARADSVAVVWFTEFEGDENYCLVGQGAGGAPTERVDALTAKLSRMYYEAGTAVGGQTIDKPLARDIWRHEARVEGLPAFTGGEDERRAYLVVSAEGGARAASAEYALQAMPQPGTPLKVLLTSDSQMKRNVAPNLQKVVETVGRVDAVLSCGDQVDVADNSQYWFDADESWFRTMQGTSRKDIDGTVYTGGALVQYAPVYTAVGNHEVMGRFDETKSLSSQFNMPSTREYAERLYESRREEVNPDGDEAVKERFIRDNSFNTVSYDEIYTLPRNEAGGSSYYAVTIGDVRLIVLDVCRIWRGNAVGAASKYSEQPGADEGQYGFGSFIFEPIDEGSEQYRWLVDELAKDEFKDARLRVVMYHWQYHSLGGNQVPAFTDPVPRTVIDPLTGKDMVTYDYPLEDDYLTKVDRLLDDAGVDLVFNGHSHVWNRFKTASGMNVIETSNVGNTYNCFYDTLQRTADLPSCFNEGDSRYLYRDYFESVYDTANYALEGDPYGLEPIYPTLDATLDGTTAEEPYVMSNTFTCFSILDTGTGAVDSYYFDTSRPESSVVRFDSFAAARGAEVYEVAFVADAEDAAIESQRVPYGATIRHPQVEGRAILGVYTDADMAEPFDFNAPILGDTTLYVQLG